MSNTPTPRTDAELQRMDMEDLEFGHKFRELRDFARTLERELAGKTKDYDCMVYNWRGSENGYNEMDRRRLAAEKEVERLKRGEFTREEFQNLCHNRHEKPGCTAQDFFDGCAAFQKSMFGHSEREDKTPPK